MKKGNEDAQESMATLSNGSCDFLLEEVHVAESITVSARSLFTQGGSVSWR